MHASVQKTDGCRGAPKRVRGAEKPGGRRRFRAFFPNAVHRPDPASRPFLRIGNASPQLSWRGVSRQRTSAREDSFKGSDDKVPAPVLREQGIASGAGSFADAHDIGATAYRVARARDRRVKTAGRFPRRRNRFVKKTGDPGGGPPGRSGEREAVARNAKKIRHPMR